MYACMYVYIYICVCVCVHTFFGVNLCLRPPPHVLCGIVVVVDVVIAIVCGGGGVVDVDAVIAIVVVGSGVDVVIIVVVVVIVVCFSCCYTCHYRHPSLGEEEQYHSIQFNIYLYHHIIAIFEFRKNALLVYSRLHYFLNT
jgi:hypothetical protein